jgi:hypothetical protein
MESAANVTIRITIYMPATMTPFTQSEPNSQRLTQEMKTMRWFLSKKKGSRRIRSYSARITASDLGALLAFVRAYVMFWPMSIFEKATVSARRQKLSQLLSSELKDGEAALFF